MEGGARKLLGTKIEQEKTAGRPKGEKKLETVEIGLEVDGGEGRRGDCSRLLLTQGVKKKSWGSQRIETGDGF